MMHQPRARQRRYTLLSSLIRRRKFPAKSITMTVEVGGSSRSCPSRWCLAASDLLSDGRLELSAVTTALSVTFLLAHGRSIATAGTALRSLHVPPTSSQSSLILIKTQCFQLPNPITRTCEPGKRPHTPTSPVVHLPTRGCQGVVCPGAR